MVSLHSMLVGVLVLTFSHVNASPLESSPYMPLSGGGILNNKHPAFGAALNVSLRMVIPKNRTSTGGDYEEAIATYDLKSLEDYYRQPLERNFNYLPARAEITPTPWPGSYWPTYADGINYRSRHSELSPAEKYAQAFNLNVKQFTDTISQQSGILSQRGRRTCRRDNDCDSLQDNSACAIRYGESSGYCIPTWFGICHAWAPAAILEPEPRCAVRKNGVTFRPIDIKALITQIYDGARVGTVYAGARYNGEKDAKMDSYGRFIDAAYRDLNPGLFHLALANILGRFHQSFVIDVTASAEVWNQPLRKYEVLEQYSYSPQDAAKYFYRTSTYPFNSRVDKIMYIRARVSWIVESEEDGGLVSNGRVDAFTRSKDYTYLLELDRDSNIIGGEWLYNSHKDHPDFMWFSTGRPSMDTVTSVGLSYRNVRELLDEAAKC